MILRIICFWTTMSFLLSVNVFAKEVLHSAVSPEFPDGLHTKYLQFIANKMDMNLDVAAMPFARRIKELHNGQIDLLVGMRKEKDVADDIVFLQPSYENLRQTLFILTTDKNRFESTANLQKARIATTYNSEYLLPSNTTKTNDINVITVPTLKQKIEMLLKGRIDCFMHHEEITFLLLHSMGLEDKITTSVFQPNNYEDYYVSISKKSSLYPHRDALEKMLKLAVDNNDFIKIRNEHYQH